MAPKKPGAMVEFITERYGNIPDAPPLRNGHVLSIFFQQKRKVTQTIQEISKILGSNVVVKPWQINYLLKKTIRKYPHFTRESDKQHFHDVCDQEFTCHTSAQPSPEAPSVSDEFKLSHPSTSQFEEVLAPTVMPSSPLTVSEVVLVTDGSLGIGKGSLRHSLQTLKHRGEDKKFPLPFPFPTKLYILCIANSEELQMTDAMDNLEHLLCLSGGDGQIFTMEGPLCMKSVQTMFGRLIDHAYSPFHAVLHCGNLSSDVQVFPRPEPMVVDEEVEPMPRAVSTDLEIVGFIEIADISSPPVISRHLVLPIAVNKDVDEVGAAATDELEDEPSATQMAGKSPNFCVLLHGSLKVEGMVALVQLGPEWYGMLYSQADSKKKSNLMMSLFEPGSEPLPWLGKISYLGPVSEAAENPYGEDDSKSPFPVQPPAKRSYAQNVTVWIKASGLQADVQKILRNARKLPDKTQTFYKELNRMRKAALAFGFLELLKGVADLLERECTLLPDSAHPDAAFQLSHAAQQLKLASTGDSQYADFDHSIAPMHTDFSS